MNKVLTNDIYTLKYVNAPTITPDERHVLVTVYTADSEHNDYSSQLYMIPIEGGDAIEVSRGRKNAFVMWDGEKAIITSAAEHDMDANITRLYSLDPVSRKIKPYSDIPLKAAEINKGADGCFYFISQFNDAAEDEPSPDIAKRGIDYDIFDELPFWANAKGIVNKKRNALVKYDPNSKTCTRLSDMLENVECTAMSPNGQYMAYSSKSYSDVMERSAALKVIQVDSKEPITLIEQDEELQIESVSWFNDNDIFFCGGKFRNTGENPEFFKVNLKEHSRTMLPFADVSIADGITTDASYGAVKIVQNYGGSVFFRTCRRNHSPIMKLDESGSLSSVTPSNYSIVSFDIRNGSMAYCAFNGNGPCEVYYQKTLDAKPERLSSFNVQYVETHCLANFECFTFTNDEGTELDGYIMKPTDYKVGLKYPAVLQIHGGPKGAYGTVFHHEMQCMASNGYFVIYTNPEGSDGRGEAFANIDGKLGKRDYMDIMQFVDAATERYNDIDKNKIGVCGGSYGGFMCNFIIGHTDMFAAAVSQRSISNYLSKTYTTDIGYYHNVDQLRADPWEDFQRVWEASPLKNAHKAKTPTLFIQSDEDYRCWMGDAVQMFTALKLSNTPARLTLFHGEDHNLSRSGRPRERVRRLNEIMNWFEKYLKD